MADQLQGQDEASKTALESVKDAFRSRLADDFYGSFIIGFILWNWRPLLYLFYPTGELNLDQRLRKFDDFYRLEDPLVRGFWFPLGSAIVAMTIIPWFRGALKLVGRRPEVWWMNSDRQFMDTRLKENKLKINELNKVIAERQNEINKHVAQQEKDRTRIKKLHAEVESRYDADINLAGIIYQTISGNTILQIAFIKSTESEGLRRTTREAQLLQHLGLIRLKAEALVLTPLGEMVLKMVKKDYPYK